MLPQDFEGTDVVEARIYRRALEAWEKTEAKLVDRQSIAGDELIRAEDRLVTLNAWATALGGYPPTVGTHARALSGADAAIAKATAAIAQVNALISDAAQAYELATARLLNGPAASVPIVLFPLRLETHWDPVPAGGPGTLHVRIYPDVLSIDSHNPILTTSERTAGDHYWKARASGTPVDGDQAWAQLVRASSPQRAAWIVQETNPAIPHAPETREPAWDVPVTARLLPDRFAVLALSNGEPVNLAGVDEPPRFVTWSAAVGPDPLPCGLLAEPGSATWMTNLDKAREVGMAVSITVAPDTLPFDTLAVIGLRTDPTPDLAGLLDAHAFTDGLEILNDGTPTNNSSSQIRAAHSPRRDVDVARALIEPGEPPDPAFDPSGAAGAQLAFALGIPTTRLTYIAGTDQPRQAVTDAIRLLVGLGATGALRDRLAAAGVNAWPLVQPNGPAPTLRVGRQPYGILPVTAPSRWQPLPHEPHPADLSAALADQLHQWALATGPPVAIDPGAPPLHLGGGPSRHVSVDDDTALPQLLLQAASTLRWSGPRTSYAGLDQIIGPVDGDNAPAAYLERIARAAPADLAAVASTLPAALLARVAYTAKQRAPADGDAAVLQVNTALRLLATVCARPSGRDDLARELTLMLDACSHRFDAWVTGIVNERLKRTSGDNPVRRVGAVGLLTDVRPRTEARSYGHVHAPSLGHAATAAVLRAGFLGQRRQAGLALATARTHVDQVRKAREELVASEPDELGDNKRENPERPAWRQQLAHLDDELAHAQATLGGVAADLAGELRDQARTRDPLGDLAPLDPRIEARLPMAVDLSSRQVREGTWILAAVRAGQPLAAVLGYQFERDLIDAGLPQYLASFRKMTRFTPGTALEALEEKRRLARINRSNAQEELERLEREARDARSARDLADTAAAAAAAGLQRAESAAAPYTNLRKQLKTLVETTIPNLKHALDDIDQEIAKRAADARKTNRIRIPKVDF